MRSEKALECFSGFSLSEDTQMGNQLPYIGSLRGTETLEIARAGEATESHAPDWNVEACSTNRASCDITDQGWESEIKKTFRTIDAW